MREENIFGRQIAALRRQKSYTQEQLSSRLNVTPQAVSKWESGNGFPDISLLPVLAKLFDISIDKLLTGNTFMEKISPYDDQYRESGYYWGIKQSSLAERVMELREARNESVLDIGSGEGRDAVYFAKCGFDVDALEISAPGVEKIKQYCTIADCQVHTIHENMINYPLNKKYHLIYSMGTLQFLPREEREHHFASYKEHTHDHGLNAHLIFVEKPFVSTAPDWQKNEFFYRSGDLASYYSDWEIIFQEEKIMDCNSAGIAHQHAVNAIIAKKVPRKHFY